MKGGIAPVSSDSHFKLSSFRASSRSAALSKMVRRSAGFVFAHAGPASSAASTADRTSSLDAEAHFQTTSPVLGEVTLNVVDVVISLPLISSGTVYIDSA
jgi:hypothetical protein